MERSQVNYKAMSIFGRVPARFVVGGLVFLASVTIYMLRVNLSVAIVAMVRRNNSATVASNAECLVLTQGVGVVAGEGNSTTHLEEREEEVDGEMDWDALTQGVILASYYYGYACTQIIGGRLAEIYGTKRVLGGCIFISAIWTLVTPIAARAHYGALIAIRVVLGLCSGVSWPAMQCLVARWIPPLERPRFVAIVILSSSLSVTFTLPLCALIIDTLGWDATFYLTGTLALVWCVLWFPLMHDFPLQHPRISMEELEYIETTVTASGVTRSPSRRVPWRQMTTSMPVLAIIICDIGNCFGLAVYVTQLPTYMKNVLGFSIRKNGLLSGLPFLSRYVGAVISSSSGDWLVGRGYLTILNARRIYSAIAMLGPAVGLLAVAHAGCEAAVAVALLCLSLFLNGAITTSQLVNQNDIAPNYAGTVFGISNTFGAAASFVAPVAVGAITNDQQTMGQWQKVFWMCVPIYVVTELFFLVFSSGSVQSWNYYAEKHSPEGTSDSPAKDVPEETVMIQEH
ncbi:sialin [Procambarus clarkii]|uniref:sialin n=1 Tax=Procambarus clarkii TaxID=6728 RepID=UPI001E671653|nr:sialin-like [Procambarus clarkii]XP_045591545.1 sialin-like [Procambarus clarkii]